MTRLRLIRKRLNERFHVILTSEDGRTSFFQVAKKNLLLAAVAPLAILAITITGGYFASGKYFSNRALTDEIASLRAELAEKEQLTARYLSELEQANLDHRDKIADLTRSCDDQLTALQTRSDLISTSLQLENARMMSTTVSDLQNRCEAIELVMDTIGVEIIDDASSQTENAGGPFIPDEGGGHDDLMKRVDHYLRAIKHIPLGRPLDGAITSSFGTRADPLNHKRGIHEGVDIRGKRGDKIRATAAGTVLKAFKNGGYGNYVEIDHGNGYRTVYAHLQNYLVKKGDTVGQGEVIGQVGATGRSTGPHLHYEIRLNKKPVNPNRFMQVADLSHTISVAAQ